MRLLYLIKSFDFGGAENHVKELANSMSDLGNDVFVVSEKGRQAQLLDSRIKFISLRLYDAFLPFQIIFLCYIIYRYRIDVIHAHKRLAILAAAFSGWIMNRSVVATVHGRPRYDMRSRLSRRLTDRVIFVNNTTYQANCNRRHFRNKSVLIHNGARKSVNDGLKNHYAMLYVCRIDRKHSEVISMIINEVIPQIIRRYPEVTFEIAGDGEFFNKLKEEAEAMNDKLERRVFIFHGLLDDVFPVVNRSGIVMGVGRVALEALSCSVPVISLNRKFMGEMISRNNFEFYRQNNFVAIGHHEPDPVVLTGILDEYLRDPLFWHNETRELHKIVENNLSIEKVAAEIFRLYSQACLSKN